MLPLCRKDTNGNYLFLSIAEQGTFTWITCANIGQSGTWGTHNQAYIEVPYYEPSTGDVLTFDGDEWVAAAPSSGSGLTDDIKEALLQIAQKVAYIDSGGQDYYDDLYDALYPLTGISAVYTPTTTIYNTDTLNDLIPDLVVTAEYDDGSSETVSSSYYTLSGQLTVGTSTITVSYQGFTDTFTVTVVEAATLVSIEAVYTQGTTVIYPTDPLSKLTDDLVVTAIFSDTTETVIPAGQYSLSGVLSVGSSTITASYGGQTDTFTVTVSAVPTLSYISALYTQSGTVYDNDSLDSLKSDLVVTATYSDSSTATVAAADYTLSGTLAEGTSTVTVTYQSKTTTFTVTVTEADPRPLLHKWDFTQSLADSVGSLGNAVLSAGTGVSAPVRTDGQGVVFNAATQMIYLGKITEGFADKTIEYDVKSVSFVGNSEYHIRQLVLTNENSSTGWGMSPLVYRATSGSQGWSMYGFTAASGVNWTRGWANAWSGLSGTSSDVVNFMNGKTIGIKFTGTTSVSIYVDGVLLDTQTGKYWDERAPYIMFGGMPTYDQTKGDQCYNLTLSAIRIYENEE